MQKELNWMPRLINASLLDMMKEKKGWKCMDPKTHKFIVSRDVVFDEVSSY